MNGVRLVNWLIAWLLTLAPMLPTFSLLDNSPVPVQPPVVAADEPAAASPVPEEHIPPISASNVVTPTTICLPLVVRGYQPPPDADGDGLPDNFEDSNDNGIVEPERNETDPHDADCDDDGLTDGQEVRILGSDPWSAESDGDTLGDYLEVHTTHTNPAAADTDADGRDDGGEDADRDGVLDPGETDPNNPDTDGEGLNDGEEVTAGEDGYVTDPQRADTDGDGLTDAQEAAAGTHPLLTDGDADGLGDPEEIATGADGYVTDPLDADSDDDGLDDGAEAAAGSDPLNVDTDADDLGDWAEVITHGSDPTLPDTDADTLPDYAEVMTYTTHPANPDTDGDTLPDPWEVHYGLDPLVADANTDADGDGRTNQQEYVAGTDPTVADSDEDGLSDGAEATNGTDPLDFDTDDDGLGDGAEVTAGTGPLNDDSDGDGILDGVEGGWNADLDQDGLISALDLDSDGDGLGDAAEDADLDGVLDPGETSPSTPDTDDDGMTDPWELAHGFDPLDPADRDEDADGDGLINRLEFIAGTDPHDTDSDDDGLPDGLEADLGLDPTDPADAAADLDTDLLTNLQEYQAGTAIDNPDSDGDTIIDGQELNWNQDTDGDGAINALDPDADDDGLDDGTEVFVHFSDPLDPDTDGDGLTDGEEVLTYGTQPLNPDTDHDGVPDGAEVAGGTNPLDSDTDDDSLPDGTELVAGWNGDRAEAEDLGTPYIDPVYGNEGAVHDGTGHILTWTPVERTPGYYRVYFRARSLGAAGEQASLNVTAAGGPALSDDLQLLDQIYRWHSSTPISVAVTGTLQIELADPQAPASTSVLVDRLMLVRLAADPVYPTTWATDPDTDGDGLPEGLETVRDTVWIEAEHYRTSGTVIDDLEASNSKALRNSSPNQVLTWVPPGHVFQPRFYQILVRARRDPAIDPNATIQVEVTAPSIGELTWPIQRLTDRYEWQAVAHLPALALGVTDTLSITVRAQTQAAQAVYVDKVLITPMSFEGIPVTVPFSPTLPGGEGIHPPPPPQSVLVVKHDLGNPDLWPWWQPALDATGVWYNVWDVAGQGLPAPNDLLGYGAVIWFTGNPSGGGIFDPAAEAAAQVYLDNGGNLLLVSAGYLNTPDLTNFRQIYLGVGGYTLDVTYNETMGRAGDPIGGGLGPDTLIPPPGWVGPLGGDRILPGPAPNPFLWTASGLGSSTHFEGGTFKTVFLAWPLAAVVDPVGREAIVGAVCDWFGLAPYALQAGTTTVLRDQPSGLTDPLDQDTDGDSERLYDGFLPGSAGYLTDSWERTIGTNPFDIDTDGEYDLNPADTIIDDYGGPDWNGDCVPDGLPDGQPDWTDDVDCNPLSVDADDDQILDPIDPLRLDDDIDDDGVLDGAEDANLNGAWDVGVETNLGVPVTGTLCYSGYMDTDGDGLGDGVERGLESPDGEDTFLPCIALPIDADRGATTTDPLDDDTDGDGQRDGYDEDHDLDGQWEPALGETDPNDPDTDHDGLIDGREAISGTRPLDPHSDQDSLTDGDEVLLYHTDPLDADSDDDGFDDAVEVAYETDPNEAASRPPMVTQGNIYLETLPGTEWQRVGNRMVAVGTVFLGGMQSGGARVLNAVDWGRAQEYLAGEMTFHVKVSGTVSIVTATGTITGSGSVDVLIDGGEQIPIIEGDFAVDASSGHLTGDVSLSTVPVGSYGRVSLSSLQDVTVDVSTGEIEASGQATLTPVPGLSTVLSGTFVVRPKAYKMFYAGQLDLEAGSVTIPLRGVEAEVDLANGYFSGKSTSVEIPNIGKIVETSTPQTEFVLDTSEGRLRFSVDSGVSTSLTLGIITLTAGAGGPGFTFETDLDSGYFYLQVSSIDLGVATINNVEIEIDPSGNILFEPEYTVPGYLTEPFSGHIRFAGDVSVVIPVRDSGRVGSDGREGSPWRQGSAWPEDERESGPGTTPEEQVGLMLNVQGEQVIRVPGADGFLWATNAALGLEVSASVVTLGIEMGGTTSVYSLGGSDPLLAIALGVEGLALQDLGLNLPDAFGNITPIPGETAVFVYHIEDMQLEGAGVYNYWGLELSGQFTVTASAGMTVAGQLDVPLGGLQVEVTGALDWDGNLLLAGTGDLTWLGFTMAQAGFTLDNDGLYVNGTVAIPAVGSAAVAGALNSDGTFSFSGVANVNPGSWGQMTAAVTWTNTGLTIAGTVQTVVGNATVSGSVTSSSFHLTGSGSLSLGGFGMASATVTIDSASGLYAQGTVTVSGAGSVSLAGYIQTNGYFALSGSGSLAPGGFQLASASFSLTRNAAGTRFQASGSLSLGGATVASASVTISSDGSFSGSGSVSWGGVTISVSVSMTSGGVVTLSGSISVDQEYGGYGIVGSLSLSASSDGNVSGEIDFAAKLAGETVFSGTVSVNSSGKMTFEACVCDWSWCCASVTIYL